MPDAIAAGLQELAKGSPYAFITIVIFWMCNYFNAKQWKAQAKLCEVAIQNIREAYDKSLEIINKNI